MQPENSRQAVPGAEQLPMPPTIGQEAMPSLPPLDAKFERGQARFEQAAEAGAIASDMAVSSAPMVNPIPQAPPVQAQPAAQPTVSSSPLVAGDEDLIEKEWVDKAKEIIQQTRDDPHQRTRKVNELQRDYLQKRYGKVVGS